MEDSNRLEFGVLGPLEVRRGSELLALAGAKQRVLLAVLLLNANRIVSTDRLIEDLWGESPPPTATSALQVHVSQLRRLLEPGSDKEAGFGVILTRPPGYVLQIAPDQLDLHRFEELVAKGLAALTEGRPREAAAILGEALQLWRGPALADLVYEDFAKLVVARLEELRLAAIERRVEAELACGRHVELVPELQELNALHPVREGIAAQLMLALYRSGRQAEALDVYRRTRATLVDEFGIDPGPSLQQLEREILTQEASIEVAADRESLPRGVVTLAFTDIESSTELIGRLRDAYLALLADYRQIVRDTFSRRGGREVDRQGDGFLFAFERVSDAVHGAVDVQHSIGAHDWPDGADVRVRIGLHTGRPEIVEGAYVGFDVHRAARIASAAHGRQIVVSLQTAEFVREELPEGLELRDLGSHPLKGLPEPEPIFQLVAPDLETDFPPLRVAAPTTDRSAPERAVLLIADDEGDLRDTLVLGEQLARGRRPHELILATLLAPEDKERLSSVTETLHRRRQRLEDAGVTARVATFTSSDPIEDVLRLALRAEVDLVLVPAPSKVLRDGGFDERLAALLHTSLCDVAFLVRREPTEDSSWREGPILVPFGAAEHEWGALELGAWLAVAWGRALHLLGSAETESGRRDASRLLADAGLLVQRAAGVAPEPRLVRPGRAGIVEAAAEGGLLVLGLSERWAEEGLGVTRWAIARTAAAPVLFVHRGVRPGGLAPDSSMTRFSWSVTAR